MSTSSLVETVIEVAPQKGGPRDTVRFLIAGVFIAIAAIGGWIAFDHNIDARIKREVKPIRQLTIENSYVLDMVIDGLRDQCIEVQGSKCTLLPSNDLRAKAHARAAINVDIEGE